MWPKPHCRAPGYIFGVAGEVERVAGVFADPSISAIGLADAAPKQPLYRVRFLQGIIQK